MGAEVSETNSACEVVWVETDPNQRIELAQYGGYYDTQTIELVTTYKQFFEHLSAPDSGNHEKQGPAFLIGPCRGARSGRNLQEGFVAVYDADASLDEQGARIEGAPPPRQVHEALVNWNISHCIYTTHSHGKKGNRYRIVFPVQVKNKHELRAFQTYLTELFQIHAQIPIALCSESYAWGQGWNLPRIPYEGAPFYSSSHFGIVPVASSLAAIYNFNDTALRLPSALHQGELNPDSPLGVIASHLSMQTLLMTHGYTFVSQGTMLDSDGNETTVYRYRKPGSDSPPGVIVFYFRGRWRCFSHHGNDPLNNGHANDAFDVYRILYEIQDPNEAMISVVPAVQDAINERMNAEFPSIMEGGAKLRFGNLYAGDAGGWEFRMMDQTSFLQFCQNKTGVPIVTTQDDEGLQQQVKMQPLGEYWLKSRERVTYNGLTFTPCPILEQAPNAVERQGRPYFNLFRGWQFKPYKGSWPLLEWHLRNAICGEDEEQYEYFLDWTAHLFQKPTDKIGVSMILQGGRGVGKTLLMGRLAAKLGTHAFVAGNNNLLTGNFNSHLRNKLFLVVEESFWSGNHRDRGVLQHLITDQLTAYEKKGFDAEAGVSYLRVCMISNEDWVVPAAADERRYFLPSVTPASRERDMEGGKKGHFFPALINELDNGGLEAFVYDMAKRGLGASSLRTVPATSKLQDQKLLSLDWIDRWLLHTLMDGAISSRGETPVPWTVHGCRISMRMLSDSLKGVAPHVATYSEHGLMTAVGMRIKKIFGKESYIRTAGVDGTFYLFYDISSYRIKFSKYAGVDLDWPVQSEQALRSPTDGSVTYLRNRPQ